MGDFSLKDTHLTLTSAPLVKQLCNPLKKYFKVDNLSYIKILPDLSRIHLDTNPSWTQFFYRNVQRYYNEYLTEGQHWNSGFSHLFALEDACISDAIEHDVGDGIVISNHCQGCTELVFITHSWCEYQNTQIGTLMKNVDLLQNFIEYFRAEAAEIIKKASLNPIYLPFIETREPVDMPSENDVLRKNFLKELAQLAGKFVLTKREEECIYYTSLDMSAKQIADKLSISTRTVENHINNAKSKFGFRKKSSLVKLL